MNLYKNKLLLATLVFLTHLVHWQSPNVDTIFDSSFYLISHMAEMTNFSLIVHLSLHRRIIIGKWLPNDQIHFLVTVHINWSTVAHFHQWKVIWFYFLSNMVKKWMCHPHSFFLQQPVGCQCLGNHESYMLRYLLPWIPEWLWKELPSPQRLPHTHWPETFVLDYWRIKWNCSCSKPQCSVLKQ